MSLPRTCPRCGGEYPSGNYFEHKQLPNHIERSKAYSKRWGADRRRTISRETIVQMFDDGTKRGDIADTLGVSRQWVSQVLIAAGQRSPKKPRVLGNCFICSVNYEDWGVHHASDDHRLTSEMLIERLEEISHD